MDKKELMKLMIESSKVVDSNISKFDEVIDWIKEKNNAIKADIRLTSFDKCTGWNYDKEKHVINHVSGGFFSIKGIVAKNKKIEVSQPIIIQNEIGYLGIVCKIIDGTLYFLMQAKIEPGNINVVQISPTLQATKSNFSQKHGGALPAYFDVFDNVKPENVVVDQVQSEQASRFLHKRNRNIIIYVEDDIEVLPNYRWLTLGQIRELLRIDNLVNMDTRTVLSCLPFYLLFDNKLINHDIIQNVYCYFNKLKMYNQWKIEYHDPLAIPGWKYNGSSINCLKPFPFDVVFCEIEIESREVKKWYQPLFRSQGPALFALLCRKNKGEVEFLVSSLEEVGTFDSVELGPSIQTEYGLERQYSEFEKKILKEVNKDNNFIYDHLLSEEGGRFYHEENRNVIKEVTSHDFDEVPEGYFWINYQTLNFLCQRNNVLNIQLRNLLSLVNIEELL